MRKTILAVPLLAAAVLAGATVANGDARKSGVSVAIAPETATVFALPCSSATLDLALTNGGTTALYADSALTAAPLRSDRDAFSSYLPAGATVHAPARISAPRDLAPGDYPVALRLLSDRRTTATATVTVAPAPPKGPGDNLLLMEQPTASSTNASFKACGAVDGDADSEHWSTSTGWNDGTRAVFPDTYAVALAQPASVDRVDVYTLDSARYPAARYGLRDWDVEVQVGGAWQTVAQVRGNAAGHVTSTFDPVAADAVRIVALASNSGDYSRIVELEARGG